MASAAKKRHVRLTRLVSSKSKATKSGSADTPLSGSTLSSASAAALAAVPGGTVSSATTESDGTGAYEVIVTNADGTRVKVIENVSFAVLSSGATGCH
ncbi:MAG TPA: PepSY domain-containing protein [Gaiellaceae bacterium]